VGRFRVSLRLCLGATYLFGSKNKTKKKEKEGHTSTAFARIIRVNVGLHLDAPSPVRVRPMVPGGWVGEKKEVGQARGNERAHLLNVVAAPPVLVGWCE
jgi:hypothetical protein